MQELKIRKEWRYAIIFGTAIAILIFNFILKTSGFFELAEEMVGLYFIVPMIMLVLLREKPSDYGLNFKNKKKILFYAIIFIVAAAPIMLAFKSYYIQNYMPFYFTEGGIMNLIFYEIVLFLIMLSTEFLFRGYLLFSLKEFGIYSIFPQVLPYALIHYGAPVLEILVSVPAGILFGYMAYKTKSIVPSLIAHMGIAIIFDLLILI